MGFNFPFHQTLFGLFVKATDPLEFYVSEWIWSIDRLHFRLFNEVLSATEMI